MQLVLNMVPACVSESVFDVFDEELDARWMEKELEASEAGPQLAAFEAGRQLAADVEAERLSQELLSVMEQLLVSEKRIMAAEAEAGAQLQSIQVCRHDLDRV